MRYQKILWVLFLYQSFLLTTEAGWFQTEDLYKNGVDLGITSLERNQVNETLQKTNKPWLIQFYSSWCGHCQRFAPTFKEFGIRVQGWTDVMGFGVINCAQEYNTQACRDFDIGGYPSVKLFAPHQPASYVGELIRAHDVQALMNEATNWIETLERNDTTKVASFAPDLTPFESSNLMDLWKTKTQQYENADSAILLFYDTSTHSNSMINSLLMDVHHLSKSSSNPLIIRKVVTSQTNENSANNADAAKAARELAQNIGLQDQTKLPFMVSVHRPKDASEQSPKNLNTEILRSSVDGETKFEELIATIINHSQKGDTMSKNPIINARLIEMKDNQGEIPSNHVQAETSLELIKKRRYTVFMSDIENALLYSLSHEVAQKKSIIGKSFNALQHYLELLIRLFPTKGREKTLLFLQELYKWTNGHEDGILGEDLSAKIIELRTKFNTFDDVKDYIGCKGSNPKYGNYPCALWSLWHVLTVRQAEQVVVSDPRFVLSTMVEYVDQFFGCRDCAENFLLFSENGAAIKRDVKMVKDSVLWLWKAHNNANLRLKGDIQTDDPVYPKTVFPDEQFCPQCMIEKNMYEETSNTWTIDKREYNLEKTFEFLKNLYTNIDMKNLDIDEHVELDRRINPKFPQSKNQVAVIYSDPKLDKGNKPNLSNPNLLNSKSDVSLMVLIYGASITLFLLVLLKVIWKKRGGRCLITVLPCLHYFISAKQYTNKFVV